MTINEESRQVAIAGELEATARTLAHSTRAVPSPIDSYRLLGELNATADHLAQVLNQLAAWHGSAEDGMHYDGEAGGTLASPTAAGIELTEASQAVTKAAEHISRAHSHNGVVRWYDSPVTEAQSG